MKALILFSWKAMVMMLIFLTFSNISILFPYTKMRWQFEISVHDWNILGTNWHLIQCIYCKPDFGMLLLFQIPVFTSNIYFDHSLMFHFFVLMIIYWFILINIVFPRTLIVLINIVILIFFISLRIP